MAWRSSGQASKNYQSTGVSINVTAELDQSLLARPAELQQQIGALYTQSQQALDRQVQARGEPRPLQQGPPLQPPARSTAGNPRPRPGGHAFNDRSSNGSGRGINGHGHAGNGSAMTASQRRAIASIARAMGVDPGRRGQRPARG